MQRRQLLACLAGTAAVAAISTRAPADQPVRRLTLVRRATDERLDAIVYGQDDRHDGYDRAALRRLDRLMRDLRANSIHPIDPRLYDILARIQAHSGRPLVVHSGFRTHATQRRLHERGLTTTMNSYHCAARAVDFHIRGVNSRELADLARANGAGGIGIYRSFVHVDTGPRREWEA
ncbi:MAG: YcbK family protein, partial [Erythrobacter sp.]